MIRLSTFLLLVAMALPLYAQNAPAPTTVPTTAPAASPADAYKDAQQKLRARQYAQALELAQNTLKLPTLLPADKARFLKLAADASHALATPDSKKAALDYLEKIIADPAIANPTRIDTLKSLSELYIASLAGLDLFQMDLAPAQATLERALTLPNLTPEEKATALTNLGDLYRRQDKHALAREQYEKASALPISDKSKAALWRLIAGACVSLGDREKALAIYSAQQWDALSFYTAFGPVEKLQEECLKVLSDPASNDNAKWAAFRALPAFNWQATDLKAIQAAGEKNLDKTLSQNPSRILALFPLFKKAKPDSDPAFILWAGPYLLQSKLSPADYTLVQWAMLDARATQSDAKTLQALAAALAADTKLTPQARAAADLVASALSNQLSPALERCKDLPAQDKAQALLSAAKTALRANQEAPGRALYQAHLALLAQLPRAQITCNFTPNSPSDLGGFLASPLQTTTPTAALDRPYGDNLKFLVETDSAMTGRQADAQAQAPSDDSKTDIQFLCDASGIHLFIKAYDAQLPQVLAGTARAGGFEIYLAPGPRQPYYTLLGNLPAPDFQPELFLTSYPNPNFRLLSEKDHTFRADTRPIPAQGAFASHVYFSWLTFYDKLPANDTPWQFEAIRWTRSGGFSFAGSKSVHNRSSWGDLRFANLTPENLREIKRSIIYQALPLYRKAKESTSPVGNWADPVLGDPTFFNAHVKPLLAQLDKHASRVNKDMSPQDIDDLFANAVPGWMELSHNVSALRRQYLQDKLTAN
jgi:hypothetical protein